MKKFATSEDKRRRTLTPASEPEPAPDPAPDPEPDPVPPTTEQPEE